MGIVDIELGELSELAAALGHYADVVLRLVPSVSPVPASCATPLMAGEALGLHRALAGLASYGWPTEPAYAEALRTNCRTWAERLCKVPGARPGPRGAPAA